jgi:uncharacterized protein
MVTPQLGALLRGQLRLVAYLAVCWPLIIHKKLSTTLIFTGNPYTMQKDGFEWDDTKAAANYAAHGVCFEDARSVFKDPFAIEQVDDREDYGEERFTIIGMVENRLLFVAYSMRGENIRIISARGAEPHERRSYHEENT